MSETPAFSPGDRIAGRYRVVRYIARGGTGEVYEAEDLELKDEVALKVVRREVAADAPSIERFRREIQVARRIAHPNVCRIFDLGKHAAADGEVTFLTMELLRGETLEERLSARGRMSVAVALPLIRQMAGALEAAHRAGVIHRDFKPGNVILVPDDAGGPERAVVTDFGFARLGEKTGPDGPRTRLTAVGTVVGTAIYMAPEQALGDEATGAVDVYALGLVMYEMVTGFRPHQAPSAQELLMRRVQEPPPSPRLVASDLPSRWDAAIVRCLAREPADRFPSPLEAVRALDSSAAAALAATSATAATAETDAVSPHQPARGSSPSAPTVGAAPVAARRAGAAALLVGALVVLVAATLWLRRAPAPPARGLVRATQVTTSAGLDLNPAFSPDGLSLAYSSDRSGAFEVYVAPLTPGGREIRLTSDGKQNFQPAFSPDGQRIAYHSKGRGGIWVVPALGGAPRQVSEIGSHPVWSPDGKQIVFQSEPLADVSPSALPALPPSTLWSVGAEGGTATPLTRPGDPAGGHGAPSFSADGKRIVFVAAGTRNAEIWWIPSEGGPATPVVTDQPASRDPVFSADGSTLYYGASPDRDNYGIVWSSLGPGRGRAGKPMRLGAQLPGRVRHLALSRDGKRLALSALSLTSNIWSLPAAGGRPRALTAETGRSSRPSVSPDGRSIAFSKWRPGANEDIWRMDADGGNAVPLTTHPGVDTRPDWFPDGKALAFLSNRGGRGQIWRLEVEGGRESLLLDLAQDVDSARISPDGKSLAFNSAQGGTINVWLADLATRAVRPLTTDRELAGWACWAPDGKSLGLQVKRGDATLLGLVPASGGEPELLTKDGVSWPHSFSPDGKEIAFAGLRDGVWNLFALSLATRAERQLTRLEKLNAYVRYPSWSPAGDQIAYEYAETTGNIWIVDGLPR